jgi:glycosyltransferase involved in cell wall biosynthesis
MSQVRLAYLIGRLAPAGAELQMISLIRHLTQDGFDVDVLLRAGSGPLDADARAAGARLRRTGLASPPGTSPSAAYARRLSRPLRFALATRGRYDIVDAWLYPADVEAALSRPLTRVPVIMSARLGRSPRDRFGPASGVIDALVNRMTDLVVANARITADDAIRGGVPRHKVRVIRGGVRLPPSFSAAERRRQRSTLGARDEHFLIGSVGNFRPMKRQDLLLDAFAQLLPDQPQLRLVLVGDGDLRPRLERRIEALGLRGHVHLTGSVADIAPVYDAMDLFVQASNSEGLPNVLLEASAAGLPIVATAAGGSGELVQDDMTGLLVPVDDLDRLARAIRLAVADADLRRRLGAAAREAVERDYGMDRFFGEYAQVYREQLEAKRRSS